MSDPIKIVVTAETAQAAAALKAFLEQTGSGLKGVAKDAAHASGALFENRMALMELGHVGRATAESLAFGMNPLKVLALESPRIIQALSMMGIGLAAIAPYAAAAAVAVGAGYLGWKAYMSGVEDTTKANEDLVRSLEKVPALLEKINSLQKAGLISKAAAAKFAGYLGENPKEQLYYQADGSISTQKYSQIAKSAPYSYDNFGNIIPGKVAATTNELNKPLTVAQASDYVDKQGLPQVAQAQADAAAKLKDLVEKARVESLEGLEKETAAIHDKYEKEREEIRLTAEQAGKLIGPGKYDAATVGAIGNVDRAEAAAKLTAEKKAQAEQDRQALELEKSWQEYLQTDAEIEKSITDDEKKQREELARQLQLQQEINRAKNAAAIAAIQSNPFLTKQEKQDQSLPLLQQQSLDNQARLAQLRNTADTTTDDNARLTAEKEYYDLKVQESELQNKMAAEQHPWATQFAQLKSQAQITMTTLAATFANVFNSAIQSISSGITGLIMGTKTWSQALYSISTTILTDIVQSIVQMGVRWVMTQIMMAMFGKAIMASAIAATAPMAAAQSAIWAVPATLSTIASYGTSAAAAPGMIAAASAMTLGLAAFAEGGYTGDGGKWDVAGIVHAGEYVFPQEAVSRIGVDNLEAMHKGGSGAAAAASGGGRTEVHNFIYQDQTKMMNDLAKSDAFEKNIVDLMSRHIHKFR